jgi:tRNA pseudouridine65 synthase
MEILFQDEHLIAINKESGLLVHPDPRDRDAPSAMKLLRDQINAWVYPIHRIDRATSGVVLFAKNADRARELAGLFEARQMQKEYLAWVRGWIAPETIVSKPLAKTEDHEARPAETTFVCLGHYEIAVPVGPYASARYSLAQCLPKTGRRHQIRRHLSHLRHPILGDSNHGDNQQNRVLREIISGARLMLHAHRLEFTHPFTNALIQLEAPIPALFSEFQNKLTHISPAL